MSKDLTAVQKLALEEMIVHRIDWMLDYGISRDDGEGTYEPSFDPDVLRSLVRSLGLDTRLDGEITSAENELKNKGD